MTPGAEVATTQLGTRDRILEHSVQIASAEGLEALTIGWREQEGGDDVTLEALIFDPLAADSIGRCVVDSPERDRERVGKREACAER